MGLERVYIYNNTWAESRTWPQQKWCQRSSRGHWPLRMVTVSIHWCISMGVWQNDPWVEVHMWPQGMWVKGHLGVIDQVITKLNKTCDLRTALLILPSCINPPSDFDDLPYPRVRGTPSIYFLHQNVLKGCKRNYLHMYAPGHFLYHFGETGDNRKGCIHPPSPLVGWGISMKEHFGKIQFFFVVQEFKSLNQNM